MRDGTEASTKRPVLYLDETECCGCGLCSIMCPSGAIEMKESKAGFLFPVIDEDSCVSCMRCVQCCAFNSKGLHSPSQAVYAAAQDDEMIKRSASGGVFASIAESVLRDGGIVYGCGWRSTGRLLEASFLRVTDSDSLGAILGSKYVQSDISAVLPDIRRDVLSGRIVLVGAVPCQIGCVKEYLGGGHRNLLTMDLVCHGFPSRRFLEDELREFVGEQDNLVGLSFRNKEIGWGPSSFELNGIIHKMDGGKTRIGPIKAEESPYYFFFEGAQSVRPSCTRCPYSCPERIGDITVGDYWGIEVRSPKLLKQNGGIFDEELGVSILMCNSDIGERSIEKYGSSLIMHDITFEDAANCNRNLISPTTRKLTGRLFLTLYGLFGYKGAKILWRCCRVGQNAKLRLKSLVKAALGCLFAHFGKRPFWE